MSRDEKLQQPLSEARKGVRGILEGAVRDLSPAYFAMVMATGIVSIAAHLLGMRFVAVGLFWLNIGVYSILWILSGLRIILCTRALFSDLIDHQRGHGFFTAVAASCVLGSQFVLM